ncbi:MAG TPA: retropepsin-like aspartic protease [Candidatus Competibacteraceae bacterium]|nr:retropepsin-like aspartic protease [Candidatus Competibacteraceae bacterium]
MYYLPTRRLSACVIAGLILATAVLSPFVAFAQQSGGLRQQLTTLAQQHGFTINGLEQLSQEPATAVSGDLRTQVSLLLGGYNFIVLEDGQGAIREIRILGQRTAQSNNPAIAQYNPAAQPDPALPSNPPVQFPPIAPSGPAPAQYTAYAAPPAADHAYTIKTTRRGPHHHVEVMLSGPNGYPQVLTLLIDTGATTVVLPASLSSALGFRQEDLQDGWTQTASGRVPIKRGILASVKIGEATAENVEVSFIADELLGTQKILGMSFLRNFRMSLDDKNNELILLAD